MCTKQKYGVNNFFFHKYNSKKKKTFKSNYFFIGRYFKITFLFPFSRFWFILIFLFECKIEHLFQEKTKNRSLQKYSLLVPRNPFYSTTNSIKTDSFFSLYNLIKRLIKCIKTVPKLGMKIKTPQALKGAFWRKRTGNKNRKMDHYQKKIEKKIE